MEILSCKLPATHRIVLAGDLHLGNSAIHRKGWEQLLNKVRQEKDLYVFFMGDLMESITVDDPRFSGEVHDARSTPIRQMDMLLEDLFPIKDKIIGMLFGNHEYKLIRFGDLVRVICDKLDVPYGGYTSKVSVFNKHKIEKDPMYRMFLTHGRFSVNSNADDPLRRESNMRLSLKRRLHPLASDTAIMACGHIHRLIYAPPAAELYMYDDGKHLHAAYTSGKQHDRHIDPNLRHYLSTGSFLKSSVLGATTYTEFACYAPVQLGWQEVVVESGVIVGVEAVHLGTDK